MALLFQRLIPIQTLNIATSGTRQRAMGKTETFVPRKQLDDFRLMDLERAILCESDYQPILGTHLEYCIAQLATAFTASLQKYVLEPWCPNLRYGSGINRSAGFEQTQVLIQD